MNKSGKKDELGLKGIDTVARGETRLSYNRLSKWYDLIAGNAERKYKLAALELLGIRKGDTVMEVGPGTGEFLVRLAHYTNRVFGIDLSDGMVKIARKKIIHAGIDTQVHLTQGDGSVMPYAKGSFDAILICFTLELFAENEITAVIAECKRVLSKGGRLCVTSMAQRGKTNFIRQMYEWFHSHYPKYVDCHPIPLREKLTGNGFQIVQIKEMTMCGLPVDIVKSIRN